MTDVFVIRNQQGLYLSKQDEWIDGSDNSQVAFVKFHDQAVNTLVELNAKDFELRGDILCVTLSDKKRPEVVIGETPEQKVFEPVPLDQNFSSKTDDDEQSETIADQQATMATG